MRITNCPVGLVVVGLGLALIAGASCNDNTGGAGASLSRKRPAELVQELQNPDPKVRAEAARALKDSVRPGELRIHVPALRAALKQEKDEAARAAIQDVLNLAAEAQGR